MNDQVGERFSSTCMVLVWFNVVVWESGWAANKVCIVSWIKTIEQSWKYFKARIVISNGTTNVFVNYLSIITPGTANEKKL